jgi:hypothetical protein
MRKGGRNEATGIIRVDALAHAGIEGPQDGDRRHQRLAADRGLKGQGDERRKVLAQRCVAGQHGVEMAALLQPGEGAARRDRRDQGRRIDGLPEGRDGLVAIGLGQCLDGAEHAVHPGLGAAAHRLLLGLHGVVGAAVHPGQELVAHLDQLVEQALARFDQGADDERVAFGLGKPPEVAGIVAAAELAELTDDLEIDPFVSIGFRGRRRRRAAVRSDTDARCRL